jgi:hypothetical protein
MCHLERASVSDQSLESDVQIIDDEYVLVAIMTTLCPSNRNDFIVYNNKIKMLEKWESMDRIRSFWCVPEKVVENASELHRMRTMMFDKYQWIYDETRCIPRDTKHPGNKSESHKTKSYRSKFVYWTIKKGTRFQPFVNDDIINNNNNNNNNENNNNELSRAEKAKLKKQKEEAELKVKLVADAEKLKVLKAKQIADKKQKILNDLKSTKFASNDSKKIDNKNSKNSSSKYKKNTFDVDDYGNNNEITSINASSFSGSKRKQSYHDKKSNNNYNKSDINNSFKDNNYYDDTTDSNYYNYSTSNNNFSNKNVNNNDTNNKQVITLIQKNSEELSHLKQNMQLLLKDIQKLKDVDSFNPIIMDRYKQLNALNYEIADKQREEREKIDEERINDIKRKERNYEDDRRFHEKQRRLQLEYEERELRDFERKRRFDMDIEEKIEKELSRSKIAILESEANERRRMEERRRMRERSEDRMLEKEKEILHMQEKQKDNSMLRREKVLDLQHIREREKKDDLLRVIGLSKNVLIKELDFNN